MQEMRACCDVERESLGDGRGFMRPVAWSVVGLGMDAWLQDPVGGVPQVDMLTSKALIIKYYMRLISTSGPLPTPRFTPSALMRLFGDSVHQYRKSRAIPTLPFLTAISSFF